MKIILCLPVYFICVYYIPRLYHMLILYKSHSLYDICRISYLTFMIPCYDNHVMIMNFLVIIFSQVNLTISLYLFMIMYFCCDDDPMYLNLPLWIVMIMHACIFLFILFIIVYPTIFNCIDLPYYLYTLV